MLGLFILPLLCIAVSGEDGASHCCYNKKVGEVNYVLVEKGDTTGYSCTENCVYEDRQDPGSKFCFKTGEQPVTCLQEYAPPLCCGLKKKGTRIVGGTATDVNEYPWIVGLTSKGTTSTFCGGTLVSAEWVITASHCLTGDKTSYCSKEQSQSSKCAALNGYCISSNSSSPNCCLQMPVQEQQCEQQRGVCKYECDCEPDGEILPGLCPKQAGNSVVCCKPKYAQPGYFDILIGEHDQKDSSETGLTMKLEISEIIPHPKYHPNLYYNDIALLKLKQPVDVSVYTPACLPEKQDNFTGKLGYIYGWGLTIYEDYITNDDYPFTSVLLEAYQTILSLEKCKKLALEKYNRTDIIIPGMICAGGDGKMDTCQGDSGGPLTVEDATTRQHVLAGATSFGHKCAALGHPGVYADVAHYRDWLDSHMKDATFCPI